MTKILRIAGMVVVAAGIALFATFFYEDWRSGWVQLGLVACTGILVWLCCELVQERSLHQADRIEKLEDEYGDSDGWNTHFDTVLQGDYRPVESLRPIDDNVQFTVYRQRVINSEKWYDLLAFAHLSERPADASPNEPDPIEEVNHQAMQILGGKASEYRHTTQDSLQAVPKRGEITFLPEAEGVEFNPPRATLIWQESVQYQAFRMRAAASLNGSTVRGRVSIFLGVILISDVPLVFEVNGDQETPCSLAVDPVRALRYRRVFASYSHKDASVVEQFEQYALAIGDEYVRDWKHLRAGQVWNDQLMKLIDGADVFQLFWSSNSMRSDYVRCEWEYALQLADRKPSFIRPTYWEIPMPRCEDPPLPPPALARLHFQQLRLIGPAPPIVGDGDAPDAEAPVGTPPGKSDSGMSDISVPETAVSQTDGIAGSFPLFSQVTAGAGGSATLGGASLWTPLEIGPTWGTSFDVSVGDSPASVPGYDVKIIELPAAERWIKIGDCTNVRVRASASTDSGGPAAAAAQGNWTATFFPDALPDLVGSSSQVSDKDVATANIAEEADPLDDLSRDELKTVDPRTVVPNDRRSKVTATANLNVPGYQLLEQIGTGTFGVVWRARTKTAGNDVAIKFFNQSTGENWQMMLAEVKQLAMLHADPGIVQVLDVEPNAVPPYFVMGFAEQGSLAKRLESGPLPLAESLSIFRCVVQAMAYVHAKGIRHCDLKPGNILLDARGRPKVADFGQAFLAIDARLALGTFFYMAPEQANLNRQIPDTRWDVYALGALLYTMLTGEPPRCDLALRSELGQIEQLAQRLERYRAALASGPPIVKHLDIVGMDRSLARIIERCLRIDPQRRFHDANAILEALKRRERWQRRRLPIACCLILPLILSLLLAATGWSGSAIAVLATAYSVMFIVGAFLFETSADAP